MVKLHIKLLKKGKIKIRLFLKINNNKLNSKKISRIIKFQAKKIKLIWNLLVFHSQGKCGLRSRVVARKLIYEKRYILMYFVCVFIVVEGIFDLK